MLQRVHRCPHCGLERSEGAQERTENPWCAQCLGERVENAVKERGPVRLEQRGHYTEIIPERRTAR